MATNIVLKRTSVSGKIPLTSELELGEIAINTHDGDLFLKKDDGTERIRKIVTVQTETTPSDGQILTYDTINGYQFETNFIGRSDEINVHDNQTSQSSWYDVNWHSGNILYSTPNVEIQPSTGTLSAQIINAETKLHLGTSQEATIEYNSTDNSIDFIIN